MTGMHILLDTHIPIWALYDSPKLTGKARDLILNPRNQLYVSSISIWEVGLKHQSNPEGIPLDAVSFANACDLAGYHSLELDSKAVLQAFELDTAQAANIHKDPFDRMLIGQAKSENMLLLTHDNKLRLYNEPLVCLV